MSGKRHCHIRFFEKVTVFVGLRFLMQPFPHTETWNNDEILRILQLSTSNSSYFILYFLNLFGQNGRSQQRKEFSPIFMNAGPLSETARRDWRKPDRRFDLSFAILYSCYSRMKNDTMQRISTTEQHSPRWTNSFVAKYRIMPNSTYSSLVGRSRYCAVCTLTDGFHALLSLLLYYMCNELDFQPTPCTANFTNCHISNYHSPRCLATVS